MLVQSCSQHCLDACICMILYIFVTYDLRRKISRDQVVCAMPGRGQVLVCIFFASFASFAVQAIRDESFKVPEAPWPSRGCLS